MKHFLLILLFLAGLSLAGPAYCQSGKPKASALIPLHPDHIQIPD